MSFLGALILVVTRLKHDNHRYESHALVVDMKSNNTCTNLQNYPIRTISASGGVIGGAPMICGGYYKVHRESKGCVIIIRTNIFRYRGYSFVLKDS